MIKNKIASQKREIIWRDKRYLDLMKLIVSFTLFLLSLYFFFHSKPINFIYKSLLLVPIILTAFFVYSQLRKRYIFITNEGIRVGNIIYLSEDKLTLKQSPTFFTWDMINKINILLKNYHQGIYGGRDFYHINLMIKSKKTYDCLIYDPVGFIQTLKTLGKYNLLTKETKEKFK